MKTCWCILPNENPNACLEYIKKEIDFIDTQTLPLELFKFNRYVYESIPKEKEVIVEEFYNELGRLIKKITRTKYNLDITI